MSDAAAVAAETRVRELKTSASAASVQAVCKGLIFCVLAVFYHMRDSCLPQSEWNRIATSFCRHFCSPVIPHCLQDLAFWWYPHPLVARSLTHTQTNKETNWKLDVLLTGLTL
jgi:hypothetical protein